MSSPPHDLAATTPLKAQDDAPKSDASSPPTYTVYCRGLPFTLSRSQVEFDSPNYFTAAFLGDFSEALTRTIHTDRRPELFEIIFEYLAGYNIFPIIIEGRTRRQATSLIKEDAKFFGLDRLEREATENLPPIPAFQGHIDAIRFDHRLKFADWINSKPNSDQVAAVFRCESINPPILFEFDMVHLQLGRRAASYDSLRAKLVFPRKRDDAFIQAHKASTSIEKASNWLFHAIITLDGRMLANGHFWKWLIDGATNIEELKLVQHRKLGYGKESVVSWFHLLHAEGFWSKGELFLTQFDIVSKGRD